MNIFNYFSDDKFKITYENNLIDINNFKDIILLSENNIILKNEKEIIIYGKNLIALKLLNNEILIKGNINKIEIR